MTLRVTFGPDGSHLAVDAKRVALCGVNVGGLASVELEPGAEYGTKERDCRRCLALWRDMAREVVR